jgi:hypothetical protein
MDTTMKRSGLWLLLALATPVIARAQSPAVEAQHRRGMALRAQGQNAEAAEVFRAIYAQTREPRALARQGLAEAAAEQWVAADEHLRAALGFATDAWINTNRQALARDLGLVEAHLGTLEVVAPVAGAELRVNDAVRGRLPLSAPLRLLAGTARLELRAEGYAPLIREVSVAPGVTTPQRIELQPQRIEPQRVTPPAPPPVVVATVATPPPVPPPVRVQPPRPPPEAHIPPEPPPPTRSTPRVLGITGLALGGVWITLGVVGLVLRNGDASTFEERGCRLAREGDSLATSPAGADCDGLYSHGNTMQALSVAGFVAGGVFAAAGAVLLLTMPSGRGREVLALRCGMGPGDVGIACGGTL